MRFSTADDFDVQYMRKLKSFLDFLYKINFSNGIYTSLQLQANEDRVQKYKAYVGKGNNSSLIKSLLQRRFWI